MIRTLRNAFRKQCNYEPIGRADLNGSFTALVNRSLIDLIKNPLEGERQKLWYVTKDGIEALQKLHFI